MGRGTTAALVVAVLVFGLGAVIAESQFRLPGNEQGYAPEQPIRYSHRLHAGELGMDCLACHYGAERSRHAGIPSPDVCMACHKHVTASSDVTIAEKQLAVEEGRDPVVIVSPELRKLYDAMGLGEDLEPDPSKTPTPIAWVRVHSLPDHVYFDHRVHVARGLACQQCHGPVQTMERVRQVETMSMGWCIECHRASPADANAPAPTDEAIAAGSQSASGDEIRHVSIDCARCHY